MSSSNKIISNRLRHDEYAVLLDKSDEVTVSRAEKYSLNKPFLQTMTLGEAVQYGAWDTTNGTMSAEVNFRGAEIFKSANQYWAIISVRQKPLTGDQSRSDAIAAEIEDTYAARRAAAASDRETVCFGYGV
ncbi:MAG: hypothetical protein ING73_11690 [Rhodocyclaceae bacterium]|uniref:hypothetical protein n=1 Tax=Aquidulcibacter sp. TaxID=2052990 RepID=UPI0025BF56B6|nr:hypothetical protein [Aquidulcibacter sp.]MCA3018813.1 hypothetical protein [Rhodocyclaceae bacterium]MCA3025351.1 hypothetical protein [Rhodocyclaceae bacterium]MCA3032927.1 hypothetical protein [Rhodocyclaceae bacterium]MCA3037368.1 hypothetical protein [Rhodocyclaceae bacterium]MCA3046436.1 hypothetical protein [Rhodocyclaceae bacterium]